MTDQWTASGGRSGGVATPLGLPAAAWALAWSCLTGQLLLLGDRGLTGSDSAWVILSMLLGGLLVGWVSAGVLTARTGRLVLAWVVFTLSLVVDGIALIDPGPEGLTGWSLAHLAASLAQVVALASFSATEYFAWQRTRPRAQGPSLGPVLLIAVVVGVVGGTTPTGSGAHGVQVQVDL